MFKYFFLIGPPNTVGGVQLKNYLNILGGTSKKNTLYNDIKHSRTLQNFIVTRKYFFKELFKGLSILNGKSTSADR